MDTNEIPKSDTERHEELRILITELSRGISEDIKALNNKVDTHILVDATIHENIKGVLQFVTGFKTSLKILAVIGAVCRWLSTVLIAAVTAVGIFSALRHGHLPVRLFPDGE